MTTELQEQGNKWQEQLRKPALPPGTERSSDEKDARHIDSTEDQENLSKQREEKTTE